MTIALERTLTPPSYSHFSALFSIFLIFFYFDFRFILFHFVSFVSFLCDKQRASTRFSLEKEFWSRYLTKLSLCAPLQCQPRASCVFFKVQQVQRSPQKKTPNNNNKNCAVSSVLKFCVHRIGLRWCSMVFYLVICAVRNFRYKHILEFVQFLWKS